jgi:membrane-associated phospholipid phosphatase
VVEREASWAVFGQRYGELPGVLAFAAAATALYAQPRHGGHWFARQLPWLLCAIGISTAAALSAYRCFGARVSESQGAGILLVTCAATRLPSLLIWPPGSAGYRWAFAVSFAWGSFVACSRVVIGAHYLSDVLFSSAFACSVVAYALDGAHRRPAQREVPERGAAPETGI